MKTNFFKSFGLQLATIVFGITGAFATTSMGSSKTLADARGHYYVDEENPCVESIMCQTTDSGVICKVGSITLYGKTTPFSCPLPLWKKP